MINVDNQNNYLTGNKDFRDTSFSSLLKNWRKKRNFSQLDLALTSDVSQRHISFLESGRAKPSKEMVLQLSTVLDIPLREQNIMLTSAGFTPIYSESDLSSPDLEPVRRAVDFILRQQEPYPALVVDRYWNLVESNCASQRLLKWLIDPDKLQANFCIDDKINTMRLMFHPQGLKPFVNNWEEITALLIKRVYREAIADIHNQDSANLLRELQTYLDVSHSSLQYNSQHWHTPLLTVSFFKNGLNLNFFSTITTLGTPCDITLQELRIESLFPADKVTEENLKNL
ncbi:MAG: helix-turn-helix domain-containing protein [Cyanobacteria bacterium P01_A01_bin.68]